MVESRFFVGILSFLSIYLAIYANELDVVPLYDDVVNQAVFFTTDTKSSPLVLSCVVKNKEGDDDVKIEWEKDGEEVDNIDKLRNRYRIIESEGKFIIDRPTITDAGNYSCEAKGQRKRILAIARPKIKLAASHPVVEGEKLLIHCNVTGTDPVVLWNHVNKTVNITDRYTFKENNTKLIIENVSIDDRGDYECVAHNLIDPNNKYDSRSSRTTLVRVKGKYAALWPFLGICAEVFVLCVIIIIYEKRRNKSELDESDTDPQDQ